MPDCTHLEYRCRPKGEALTPYCKKYQIFITHMRAKGCVGERMRDNICKEEKTNDIS